MGKLSKVVIGYDVPPSAFLTAEGWPTPGFVKLAESLQVQASEKGLKALMKRKKVFRRRSGMLIIGDMILVGSGSSPSAVFLDTMPSHLKDLEVTLNILGVAAGSPRIYLWT